MWAPKVRASNLLAWLRHLSSVRGINSTTKQTVRMYRYHRVPFKIILNNILDLLDKYDARFTFTVVSSIANEELVQMILDRGHEIASHSLYHVKHQGLSFETQLGYIRRSIKMLEALGASVHGFRAPYNSYDNNTYACIDELGLWYDAGVRREEYLRSLTKPFNMKIDGKDTRFLSFPVCHLSDELLDRLPQKTVLNSFFEVIDNLGERDMSVLQLHPVRIGQPTYLGFLERLVEHLASQDYSMPTLAEMVERKLSMPTVCLSGDIDCLTFSDYLRRI